MLRRGRLLLIGAAGAIMLALLAAHAPPTRALVLRRVAQSLRTSYGIDLRAGALSYNLLTLSAELRAIRVAGVDSPQEPFAVADAFAIRFGWRTLIGDVSVERLSITAPRIDIRRHGDGTDNLPPVSGNQPGAASLQLPPIRVDDLDVSFQQPLLSAAIRGAALQLTSAEGGRLSATVTAQKGVTIAAGDRTIDFGSAAATIDLAGERLEIRELTASRPGGELQAAGSIAFRGDGSTVDLTVNASSEIQRLWEQSDGEAGPVGRVDATAHVTGLLSEPAITFETNSESFAWGDIQASAIQARGGYTKSELSLKTITLAIAGGTVEAHGVVALDDGRGTSRIEARWTDVDPRQIPGAASLADTISRNGTVIVKWRTDHAGMPPLVDIEAMTGVVSSGKTIPIVVQGSGRGDRWQLKASPGDSSIVNLTATANVGLDSRRWQASAIDGRIVLRAADLPAVIRQAREFGFAADIDPSTAGGAIDVDATVEGTLGAVRSTGRITGRAVTLAGLPKSDADASFGVDVAKKTTTGTFRVVTPGLESGAFMSDGVTLGGSLVAAGTWSGSLGDPTLDATVTGRNLTIGRRGSVPIAATGGTFDGVVKGVLTHLGGGGTLAIGSVMIGGRNAGVITADLTLAADVVHVAALAPTIKTSLDVSVGLAAPNTFDGRGTLADYDVDALLGFTGAAITDPGAVRGRVSGAITFKGELRDASSANVTLDLAPTNATLFDVPITISRPLRASLIDKQIRVDDAALTVGGLSLKIGGAVGIEGTTGRVVLDVDGDLDPLTPWLKRLADNGDLSTTGRLTGHLETAASATGLATTGTVSTTVSSLSQGDRILARDVRVAMVLKGQRAEIREATGSVLGGQLIASGAAPLGWLNQWLPSGIQIVPPLSDAPATLEGRASFDVPGLLALLGRPPVDALGGEIELAAKLSTSRPDLAAIAGDVRLERAEVSVRDLKYAQSEVTRFRLADGALVIESLDRITGTPGFSHEELAKRLDLEAGDRFDVRQWIEDRHRLERFYLDRGYHRVRIASTRAEAADRSHVTLSYAIERGPQTVIESTGDALPGEVLEALYEAWRGLPIADVVRTEFDRIVREELAHRGYYRPTVQLDFPAETADMARVTVHVARGPKVTELIVAWSGNRDLSNGELDALVAPHRAESAVWLDSQSLTWQVRQLYASRGYLQAQVSAGEPAVHDTVATLSIAIDEGVLSRLADVRFDGVDPARKVEAAEALRLKIGEPLAASAPGEAARRLKAFYTGLGYRRAAVTYALTTAKDGSVSIAWAVKEGPLYRVKDVNVVGVDTTNDGLVRKAITVEPGDPMGQTAIETTRRNLYDIGSFRRVDFDFGDSAIQPAEAGELPLTLTIQAEEPQRFQLKYGVQFSFDRSTGKGGGSALGVSVELRDRNFIGRAVQASVGAHWDPDLQTIGMLLSSPRFFGKRVRTNVYARNRREQDTLDSTTTLEGATLDDRRREMTFEQRWHPGAAWELVWGYNFSSRRFLIDRDDQHLDTGGLLAGPVVSIILDRRNSPFDATRGLFHSSSLQFGVESLGSDLGYVRYLLRQSYYQPLGRLTAAGSVRYGTIQRYSGTTPVSIIDIFFNAGGTNSVRGYPEDSLSAINIAGFALGGTDLVVLNGELRFPVSKRLGGAVFVDAGNTFASIADVTLGHLALGAGVGLRIRTPLAPLRLDFAYPFSDQHGQHSLRVHFSIGQMF